MTTLDYVKVILEKVSFDAKLFEKELKKAIKTLAADEIKALKAWCVVQFGKMYKQVIEKCFSRMRSKTVFSVLA
jgi:lactate dehydrogenase-like 2-hydroxyacid dehydrogenase